MCSHLSPRARCRCAIDAQALVERLGPLVYGELCQDVELVTGAGASFDRPKFLADELTPVFFGSALNNFGLEPFLDALLELWRQHRKRA